MKNSDYLLKKLQQDINKLQNKINHTKLYNIRNLLVSYLIKSGIVIDYTRPFIISSVMIFEFESLSGNTPFHIDDFVSKKTIELIDTSAGIHEENEYDLGYNKAYFDCSIEYSTGWSINDMGTYERTSTTYKINKKIDVSDIDKILSMTKDDIEKILDIENIETIQKDKLLIHDELYNVDQIIIRNYVESDRIAYIRKESNFENILYSIMYICYLIMGGYAINKIEKIFLKTYIRDRLKEYEPLYKQINKDDVEVMKNILKLKQENLALLNNESINEDNVFKLRK